jgi:hypothetical protein
MADSEKGPLEREIFDLLQKATLSDPVTDGLAGGRLSTADLAKLQVTKAQKDKITADTLGGLRKAVEQIARKVDQLSEP